MMTISFKCDRKKIKELKKTLNLSKDISLVRIAFTLFVWIIDEFQKGRLIYSINQDGRDKKQLTLLIFKEFVDRIEE